jgi:branched-chain amino acid transport system substrate-binding protein
MENIDSNPDSNNEGDIDSDGQGTTDSAMSNDTGSDSAVTPDARTTSMGGRRRSGLYVPLNQGPVVPNLSRRRFIGGLGGLGIGAAGLGVSGLLAACGDDDGGRAAGNGGNGGNGGGTIRIGLVTPRTGALAPFGQADDFVLTTMRERLADGVELGGATYTIEILDRDSQSMSDRAAQVAQELIVDDGIDLMVVGDTPDTTNPVADQCEANGVPCISTLAPWQPYYLGRGGAPDDTEPAFQWTYHFFWGLEDVIATFLNLWSQIETNQIVAGLFPNDPDGNAWGDPELGFPPPLQEAGYTIVDPGRYTNGTTDFSAQIGEYNSANCQILTGVPIPPDFTNFWTQAVQQGFTPQIASVGKALLFPSAIEALGDIGIGLSSEVWWSPSHPFSSSLTDQSASELADQFTEDTGAQWVQSIGFMHAVFEVAVDVLQRSSDPKDPNAIIESVQGTQLDTVVGTIDWATGPVPNVAKTQLVGGQWRAGTEFPYELIIVDNTDFPEVPTTGSLEPIEV